MEDSIKKLWFIRINYNSCVDDYTKIETISTNELDYKWYYRKCLEEWFKILCPHIDLDKMMRLYQPYNDDDKQILIVNMINNTLEQLNKSDGKKRIFEIELIKGIVKI